MQVVNERRAQPRAALTGAVVVFLGDEKIDCNAVDISATGIAVQSKVIRSAGQFLRVNFCLHDVSGAARWYDADGVIARVARLEQGVLFGVQFLVVEARAARQIHDYVEAHRMAAAAAQQREVYLRRIANGAGTSTATAAMPTTPMPMPMPPMPSVPPDELHPPPVTGEFGPPAARTTATVAAQGRPTAQPDGGSRAADSASALPRPSRTGQMARMADAQTPSASESGVRARSGTGETRPATGETRRSTGQTPIVDVMGDPNEFDQPRATARAATPATKPTMRSMPSVAGASTPGAQGAAQRARATPTSAVPTPGTRPTPGPMPRAEGSEPRRATPTPSVADNSPPAAGRSRATPVPRTRSAAAADAADAALVDASNVNLRALYRAALDEVDGNKGKKKKK